MKILGIICEYNPFHLGHKYQIETAKKLCGADFVVAIMSGNYVQRGDIAVFDKQTRAKAALKNGIDLVIELPTVMSLCSAERFAHCGVTILDALNANFISFGTETLDIMAISEIAYILAEEPWEYKESLAKHLKSGVSYATARNNALSELLSFSDDVVSMPNNILAIEYLKAKYKLDSKIDAVPVYRRGGGYNSDSLDGEFISATAARKLISDGSPLDGFVPDNTLSVYENAKIHDIKNMEKAIIASICKMSADELKYVADVSEGLENKIKKAALISSSFDELCDNIKSKRYAHSRIRRILLHAFLGIKKIDLVPPQYIKILDFNKNGQELLNKIKQETKLPLAKNFNHIKALQNPLAEEMWKKELLFDKIYDLF